MGRTMVIWFKNGMTSYFEQVENIQESFTSIKFTYFGKTSCTWREANFQKDNIAGFAEEINGKVERGTLILKGEQSKAISEYEILKSESIGVKKEVVKQ